MSELNYEWNSDDKEIDEYKDGHYTTCHSGQEIADEMNAYRKALNNSINKAKDLERQLKEARDKIQDLKNIGNMFKCFVPANIADLYNDQLKEQGE